MVAGCHVRDQSSNSPLSSPTASTSLLLVLQLVLLWARGAKAMLVTGAAICGSLATGVLGSSAWVTKTASKSHSPSKGITMSADLRSPHRRAYAQKLSACYTVFDGSEQE